MSVKAVSILIRNKRRRFMYTIVTDSCCDLNPAILKDKEAVVVLPLSYTIGGEQSYDQPDTQEKSHVFYERLRAGEMSRTSQINPEAFVEAFRPLLADGKEVLYLAFSSGLSGTYNASCIAREMLLEEKLPGRLITVDTLAASAGQGLMVYYALRNRDSGMGMEENARWVEENRLRLAHWFTVDDLNFLKRGGRCSPAAAFFGGMMNIKPVLHVNNEGCLIAREKVRGRKNALKALVDHMEQLVVDVRQQDYIFISHGDCTADANLVADMVAQRFGIERERIIISPVGPVIGSHSGPGTMALFFMARDRG
jgi:DegV family protein with EDD domain